MIQPRFIKIPRTDGRSATIRADAITALLPGQVKGQDEVVIAIGPTQQVHTPLSEGTIVKMMAAALGTMPVTVEPDAA